MNMTNPSYETQIALLIKGHEALEKRVDALQAERDKALKWGVMTLGSTVMGMAYWIFNVVTGGHLK